MKTDLRKMVWSPWCWIPSVYLLYSVLFFGSDYFFDFSGKQWRAGLTDSERVELDETRKGFGRIQNDGAPWPTFIEFKDGKIGLVYTTDTHSERSASWLVENKNRYCEVIRKFFMSHRLYIRVTQIMKT